MKIKSLFYTSLIAAFLFGTFAFKLKPEDHGLVQWMSFGEAVEKSQKQPRMIMIDIYTSWCGPCKMLAKNTFGNEYIAKYMNENFYCVRFDAETRDSVKFSLMTPDTMKDVKGKVKKIGQKPQQYVYYNTGAPGVQRSTHQFAGSILQGYNIAFPSMVFISKDIKRVDVIQGYYPPEQFEPVMKFFGSGSWEKTKFDDYQKTFKSELPAK
jgi:thioredoxin-related protein